MASDRDFELYDCIQTILEISPDAAVIGNLGTTAYTLSEVEDRDKNFYMTGAMGLTTPMGLGIAMSTDEQVTVVDGDGSLLMSMGTLSTVSTYDPDNLTVVVNDNGEFKTTGGQASHSGAVDFAGVARSCGLSSWHPTDLDSFREAYADAVASDGAGLITCDLPPYRPTDYPELDYAHSYAKHRFREALREDDRGRRS